MRFNGLSRIYLLFLIVILLSSSTSSVAGLKSDNSTYLDDNQVQTEMVLDEAHLFEEDFSDYSVHNWDMSSGSSFTSDADPAYASGAAFAESNIESTDVSNFADVENITIYFRMKPSSDSISGRDGGFYFSDGVKTVYYLMGVDNFGTYLSRYVDNWSTSSDEKYHDWNADTWHWLRINTYKDGNNRVIEFLSALNAGTDIPNTWDEDQLTRLTVPWNSITSLGLYITHSFGDSSTSSWEFDDIIVSTTYPDIAEGLLFEEDFSDYAAHSWDMSRGSRFTSDADPAYATVDEPTDSNIQTTNVRNFAEVENITIYFRIRTNSSISPTSGGIYFIDGSNTYYYKIGASTYGTSLAYYTVEGYTVYESEYYDWNADTWHWLRINTYKDGNNRVIEFLSALNAGTGVPTAWDGDVLPTLTVAWSSITALGLTIRKNRAEESITSWEFDDIIVSTTYPGTVNVVLDPVEGDFTEDFSDYSIHNWDLTNGSNFIVDGNPATVSAGINNFSSIHTTDMGDLSDHTNLTMYFRLNSSTNNIYLRHGGFYFSDGISDYYYSIGVGSSGTYLRYYVDKPGNNDKIYFTSWTENTWHWLKIDTYYDGTNRILDFSYAINTDMSVPNAWVDGGLPSLSANWNDISSIGIFISHNFESEAITEWQFDDIVINKGTAIDIPVEPEYDYTISNYGYDIYKLSGVKGQTIDLSLDAADSGLNLMIADTNFGYSVLSGFLFDNDPVLNPHNLIDTYHESIKEITYENIDHEDLWVVVYSLDMIVGDYIDRGYNFISSTPFVLDGLDVDLETNLPFTKTGVVTENGDQNWDATETKFISYSLSEGDILDFYFELDYGDLFILMFDGDSYQDIEESIKFIVENGYFPDGVDYFTSSEDGFLYFSYAPTSSVSGNIAIFSYDSYNPSRMTFTLMTSIELGVVVNNNDAGVTPTSPAPISTGYLFALPVISFIYYRKKLTI